MDEERRRFMKCKRGEKCPWRRCANTPSENIRRKVYEQQKTRWFTSIISSVMGRVELYFARAVERDVHAIARKFRSERRN
jgi:hypothetical protein